MMELFLIRHAQTQGNLERRYIGRTDEALSDAGIASFCNMAYPAAQAVYVSPMLRCRQTARILYPMEELHPVEDLRECDFGSIEGKTHRELEHQPEYRAWVAAGGAMSPPGGEEIGLFKERCCAAFARIVERAFADGLMSVAIVTHGGVIMAILERFARPKRMFYEWQIGNLEGFAVEAEKTRWETRKTVTVRQKIEAGGNFGCFMQSR